MSNLIETYTNALDKEFTTGLATEHSYRPALKALLDGLLPQFRATNEPTRVECGAPDFIVTRDNVIPMFYVEAKDIGKNLDDIAYKDQFERYQDALGNVIFTDYLEFRFYEGRELKSAIKIAAVQNKKIIALKDNFEIFKSTLEKFAHLTHETITTPTQLAKVMAKKAQMLAATIEAALGEGEEAPFAESEDEQDLAGQMMSFKEALIHDITPKTFSDIYAQTITYGMFAARLHSREVEKFTRLESALLIPKTNPFLRKVFQSVAGYELDARIAWIVDDLADAFRRCNTDKIMAGFGGGGKNDDPIIYFYENFLSEYDPALRKSRGVWFTPPTVVRFMVRFVDEILKTEFRLKEGLTDTSKVKIKDAEVHRVQILDPATGTGTFLAETVNHIYDKMKNAHMLSTWQDYVAKNLLPRVHGFEVLMASYAMAHLKLGHILEQTGYRPRSNQRLKVYLTNSLEESHPGTYKLSFAKWLSDEANEANRVKRDTPVMVVLGNPPYSGESQNKNDWIENLMADYKMEPGGEQKLLEKNPKWLNDDYCKFIRLGQWFVNRSGEGIVAYINNHSFLDNPTFRGMRWNLMRSFDEIYILDLHGNSKKKETTPDGSKDENVFDIQQGVSVNIFVKTGKKREGELAKIYHGDLYGTRECKFETLEASEEPRDLFREIKPTAPNYFFVPRSTRNKTKYEKGFAVNELFVKNSVGIVTARDELTIHHSKEEAKHDVWQFLKLSDEEARNKFNLGKDTTDWSVAAARTDLMGCFLNSKNFIPIAYRPFDGRWTCYTGKSNGFHCRPRLEIMRNFFVGENLGLITCRQSAVKTWEHVWISNKIVESTLVSNRTKEIGYVYPLYIYNGVNGHNGKNGNGNNGNLQKSFLDDDTPARHPNLNDEIVRNIAKKIGLTFEDEKSETENNFAPIDILDYIYAILHSPKYRKKYGEFLKSDFPRIPYPSDKAEFVRVAENGAMLRKLHLLENVPDTGVSFRGAGSNLVLKFEHDGREKAWINDRQFFDCVSENVWNFSVGGYRPAQKWLKDRKGRELSFDEVQHYKKIISAITTTERIMSEIDEKFDV